MNKNLKNKKRILVVAAHPDDELLGAGGTLIKHKESGDIIYCLILGEGVMSRTGSDMGEVSKLQSESQKVGKIIGFKEIYFSNFPDNSFDTVSLLSVAKEVEKYLEKVKPDVVYTHFENDLNVDHRVVFRAVLTASRPCNGNCPKAIYTFETLSSTEWQSKNGQLFRPNKYVGIEGVIEQKIMAMREYKGEIRKYPHPRSPEGIKILASFRGLESGLKFAEAFEVVREIYD